MASEGFDLATAERVLVNALAARHGADKLGLFAPMLEAFRGAVGEVKRLRVSNAAILSDAVRELSTVMVNDLNDALTKHVDLSMAVQSFRDTNFILRPDADGKYRWKVRPDSNMHDAVEKLSAAVNRVQRTQ